MVAITPRTRTVVLLQGEDEERLNALRETAAELRARAERAKRDRAKPATLLGSADPATEAEEAAKAAEQEADDFATEAEERGVKVVMRSVGRKKWADLTKAHPVREDNDGDKVAGYNIETAPEDIVPACLASPALADAEREEFLDSLTFAQFDRLAWEAHALNRSPGADPTQRLLSASSHTSSATLNSPSAPE